MALSIKLSEDLVDLEGSSEFHFGDEKATVVFGRSVVADVKFADRLTRLGRKHFEIRQAAGGYELVTDLEHPVYESGRRIVGNLLLSFPATIQLVDPQNGPKLTIYHAKSLPGNLTEEGALIPGVALQDIVWSLVLRMRKVAIVTTLAIVAFGSYLIFEHQRRIAFEHDMISDTNAILSTMERLNQSDPSEKWREIYRTALRSIYQIAIEPADGGNLEPLGTGWMFSSGRLATNAHVAEVFFQLGENARLVAVSTDDLKRRFRITGVRLHPAYDAFRKESDIKLPAMSQQPEDCLELTSGSTSQFYDVALLQLEPASSYPPPLPVASGKSGELVEVGDEIAYIGFPVEFAKFKEQALLKLGVVSGMSDFVGISRDGATDLIYHSAAGAGGASGSPVLNSEGKVIGLFSGGEVITTETERGCKPPSGKITQGPNRRQIAGAGTFYAQNVHYLQDVDREILATEMAELKTLWRNATNFNKRKAEILALISQFQDIDHPPEIDQPELSESGVLVAEGEARNSEAGLIRTRSFSEGTYVAFASSETGERIALQVRSSDGQFSTPIYVDSKPVAVFHNDHDGLVSFTVLGQRGTRVALWAVSLSR